MSMDHEKAYEKMNQIARSSIAVIDTVAQRGGFKGEEFSTIGQLRDNCQHAIQIVETYKQDKAAE